MKIAFIVSGFPLLSETFILNQITGLLDRGHQVDIYASRLTNEPKVHADVEKYNLIGRTYCYHAIPTSKIRRLAKAISLLAAHFNTRPVVLLRSLNVFKYAEASISLQIFYEAIPFVDKGPYDIVHCHFGPNGILGVLMKEIGAVEGKVVTTFRGYDLSSYLQDKGDNVYDYLFERGDLFLSVSNRFKDKLVELGCDERKIAVHRSGVNTHKLNFPVRKLKNDGQVQLLTVARLVEKKGVQYGIQAIAKVLERFPNIMYKIAGDGPRKSSLVRMIKELDIDDKVKLLGWKQHGEIVALMREADILLAPSVTSKGGDQEGIPGVLMEALASRLPVISTQHSGIPELVQDGKSGFLVPERDVDALAEKLVYLIRHPEIWPEMGQAGRAYVEEHHDINKLNDQLVETYQRLLNGELL
jgi:colanic acid/amylovoran biosynthesis glycosyltransferase